LQKLEQNGYPINPEDVAHLSPYLTEHLQRFGDYVLKLRPVAPLPNEEEVSSEWSSENDEASEEVSGSMCEEWSDFRAMSEQSA
jgi:hypothetical protein